MTKENIVRAHPATHYPMLLPALITLMIHQMICYLLYELKWTVSFSLLVKTPRIGQKAELMHYCFCATNLITEPTPL